MCGRYRISRRKQLVAEYFDAVPDDADWNPCYNIAPAQPVPIIRQHPKESQRAIAGPLGLIPSWAKDPRIGFKTINAKSETIRTEPSLRDPIRTHRCLIPADGFSADTHHRIGLGDRDRRYRVVD